MLYDIKDIFLDSFNLSTTNEDQLIIEQLVNIVDNISDKDLDSNTKLLE